MKRPFFQRSITGVKVGELLAYIGFYISFAFIYHMSLWYNRAGYEKEGDSIWDLGSFFDDSGLDYLIKFLVSIPIWWLLFRQLRHWSLGRRLLLHVIFLPMFVFGCKALYYSISEALGMYHLVGVGEIWDIYIPGLFYVLQFGILHAYNYYKENQQKLILEGELRHAALRSELSALKAQLNPHFLYNIFNTISASVPKENEHTRHLIAELSDLFRYQLKASQAELVPLKEELDFVQKYLDLEKERFKDRLDISFNIAEGISETMIPPMILQPLVENSIKHGITPLIDGGRIAISVEKIDSKLRFEVADTGVGVKDINGLFNKGIGLKNTKLRLEKLYNSTLHIEQNQPSGFIVSFAI